MWYVYILYSDKLDKYYVGMTSDIEVRLNFHNDPIESRKFTARGIPWKLRLAIPCETKNQTVVMEKLIKRKKSQKFIEALLEDSFQVEKLIGESST